MAASWFPSGRCPTSGGGIAFKPSRLSGFLGPGRGNETYNGIVAPPERPVEVPASDVGVLRVDVGVVSVEKLPGARDLEPTVPSLRQYV